MLIKIGLTEYGETTHTLSQLSRHLVAPVLPSKHLISFGDQFNIKLSEIYNDPIHLFPT